MNLAIIGFGYWGPNYARIINQLHPRVELTWIIDTNPHILKNLKPANPQTKLSSQLADFLQDATTPAAIICTPTATHYQVAKDCLKFNKHLLVEKPLTSSVKTARYLDRIARKRQLTLMVGHTFLYHSAVTYLKKYLKTGKLGRLYYAYAVRTNLGPIRTDVDAFWDLASHDLSTFYYLFDKQPRRVTAATGNFINPKIADAGFASIKFTDNSLLHLHTSWLDPVKVRKLVLVGSKKMIIFDDTSFEEKIRLINKGVVVSQPVNNLANFLEQISLMTGDIIIPKIPQQEPLKNQLKAFIRAVKTGKPPLADTQHAIKVINTLSMIQKSHAQ